MKSLYEVVDKTLKDIENHKPLNEKDIKKLESLTFLIGCVITLAKWQKKMYNKNVVNTTGPRRFEKI